MIREQLGPAALELRMRETAEADGYEVEIVIEQEPGSSGKAYAEHLATNVLRGYRVEIKPSGGHNKWVRAQPYIAAVGHGRISMLRADWNEPHKKELKAFPTPGVHDDTVDSASQGYNKLHQSKILNPTWGRRPEDSTQIIVPGTGVIRGTSHKMVRGIVWGSRAPR
jgi:predicted phage terminase large subunit-like protein